MANMLLTDGDDQIRLILRQMFEAEGYEVVNVSKADYALRVGI